MAAAIQLVPVNELRKDALRPTAGSGHNLAWKNAASHWKIDPATVVLSDDSRMLKINSSRRRSSVSQPIERDVVEHLVAREHRFGISGVVGPVVKFLVDPGSLSCRRILEGIADGLWPRRLLKEI